MKSTNANLRTGLPPSLFILLLPLALCGCAITESISANRVAIEKSSGAIKTNSETIDNSTRSILANYRAVESSSQVIAKNADAVQQSTSTIEMNKRLIGE